MIQKYYKCVMCGEYKAIEFRARKYCGRVCGAKAYYLRVAKPRRDEQARFEKAKAWAEARAKNEIR